jgi:histidinol-phosphate aminotransferase
MTQNPSPAHDLSRRAAMWGALRALAAAPLLPAAARAQSRGAVTPGPAREAGVMLASLTDGVYINANESPLGPCAAARTALERTPVLAGRYGMSFEADLEKLFAAQNGLKPENVKAHPGSFVPLRTAALAFASDSRPMAYCTPTFDSGFFGANGKAMVKVVKVPLDAQHRVDVRAMLAAAPNAGAFYICNPNNPTGLVTSDEDIRWLLANKPKDAKVLVDEAYIHFSSTARSALDLVRDGQDVIVTRTFSKIYGLAGLRCGLAVARKDILDQMLGYGDNVMPMPAVVAAEASLMSPGVLAERKAYNDAVRADLYAWFDRQGLTYIPSEANFTMVKTGKPADAVVKALAAKRVFISGSRGIGEDWVRVSFGAPAEMTAFKTALGAVLAVA